MLLALGLAIAYRGKVWNIGAEGQQVFGAIMVTWFVLLFLKDPLPAYVMIPVALLFSLLGGALFAAIPALMKSRLGINEVITTIMMTYVAVQALNWLVRGPFQDKTIPGSYPESPVFPPQTALPIIVPNTSVTIGIIISVVLCFIGYYILFKTPLGYSIRAVGFNSVTKIRYAAVIIGATLAGIGGAYLVLSSHAFQAENITAGRGFIAVAMVYFGKWRPARAFFGTFLFGAAYLFGAFFQVVGSIIPHYFLLMVPYVLTLVVLVGIARGARPPSALSVPYKREGG